jgi:hypothetical protein
LKVDLSPAVTALQCNWQTLSDLDRSIGIIPILSAGTSGRQLAAALGCSESLIRHLKQLGKASPEERRLLRAGHIGTREVLRNIGSWRELKAGEARDAQKVANAGASARGAKRIMSWRAGHFGVRRTDRPSNEAKAGRR